MLKGQLPQIVQAAMATSTEESNKPMLAALDGVRKRLAERPKHFDQDVTRIARPQLDDLERRIQTIPFDRDKDKPLGGKASAASGAAMRDE